MYMLQNYTHKYLCGGGDCCLLVCDVRFCGGVREGDNESYSPYSGTIYVENNFT
jgi:hypothetical protein